MVDVRNYMSQGITHGFLEETIAHKFGGDEDQLTRLLWDVPVVMFKIDGRWRCNARYHAIFSTGEWRHVRYGRQVNGLSVVALVTMRNRVVQDKSTVLQVENPRIPINRLNKFAVIPHQPQREVKVFGEIDVLFTRSTGVMTEQILRGSCERCRQNVYAKRISVWGDERIVSSGCVCGCATIVKLTKADDEEIADIERQKTFKRIAHKRNRAPASHLPIPWVDYVEIDHPVKTGPVLYLDTEGQPPTMWQIYDPTQPKVFVTTRPDVARQMLDKKTVYTWGPEGDHKSVNIQVCDAVTGDLMSLKAAMERIGYTLDKRYTLAEWGFKSTSNRSKGEAIFRKECFMYAARDAVAVYLWHTCQRFVNPKTVTYVLATDYEEDQ